MAELRVWILQLLQARAIALSEGHLALDVGGSENGGRGEGGGVLYMPTRQSLNDTENISV